MVLGAPAGRAPSRPTDQPPLLAENCVNAGFPPQVRICFAVAAIAASVAGCSDDAPP